MLKRFLKILISIVFFLWYKTKTRVYRLLGRRQPGQLIILTYHSIRDAQRDKFAGQMDALVKAGVIESANVGEIFHDGRYHIAVSFDDGYQNIMKNALPAMRERAIPPTVFVTTGYLGKRPGWILDERHPNYDERIINENELKGLIEENVIIGSHTLSHPDLTKIDEWQSEAELMDSKSYLEKLLSKQITLCSLPYGEVDKSRRNQFVTAGYTRVFLNVPTYPASDTKRYFMGRTDASPDDWKLEYHLKLRGAYQWLPLAIAVKKWIINIWGNRSAWQGEHNERSR